MGLGDARVVVVVVAGGGVVGCVVVVALLTRVVGLWVGWWLLRF